MDISPKTLNTLFRQLGLPDDAGSINAFILMHPIDGEDQLLWEAPFWTPSQARFLREAWEEDADWAEIVDELSTLLRQNT